MQSEKWEAFYESAWEIRRQFFEQKIGEGETSALRLIRMLEQMERFYKVMISPEGTPFFVKRTDRHEHDGARNVEVGEDGRCHIQAYKTLPTGVPVAERAAFSMDYYVHSSYESTNKIAFIVDYLREKNFDAIIELGSGYGQNLIRLHYEGGPQIPYWAGEYTESGQACCELLAGLETNVSLNSFAFDFNSPDFSKIKKAQAYKKVLVFSCHAIEQVHILSDLTLPAIASIAPDVTCIHFEPFGFQLNQEKNAVDQTHKTNFVQQKWNINLLQRLLEAQLHQQIDLEFVGKNVMGSFDVGTNPTSLAIWKNKKA